MVNNSIQNQTHAKITDVNTFTGASGEMVDTLVSDTSGGNPVEVQIFSRAPKHIEYAIFIKKRPTPRHL